MYDIIIVGAGPAGLSAAIYGVRSGKTVLVLEKSGYGGQIINTPEIENYPGIKNVSGYDFATNLYEQAKDLGAKVVYEEVTGIECLDNKKVVKTNKNSYDCHTVILATGASNRKLGLEHEEELLGAGVSYCATCDGMFFRGKDVAISGGGNTALEDALFLSNYCSHVYLIHRRDTFRGEKKLLEALEEKENVTFVTNSNVIRLNGDGRLTSITVKNKITSEESELAVSGLFVAIGQEPANHPFEDMIHTDEKGYFISGEECNTNVAGIFTAGDCRTKPVRQLTTAASDGAVAALQACNYIAEKQ